jgi:hypothetical protein
MRVQRVVMPVTGAESWIVVDDDWVPVVVIERYLAHLGRDRALVEHGAGLRVWPAVMVRVPRLAGPELG